MTTAPPQEHHLQRTLTNRHIQLIAIGGAIGTGLFMGSGKTIAVAGPSILLVYLIIGVALYFMMRAMGELLLDNLAYRSFQDFCADILGPWAGFVSGWTYWMCWIVTGMAEVIAIIHYVDFWAKNLLLSAAISGLILLALLGLNMLAARLFGELEFWFALIKIIAIVALLVIGIWMLVTRFTSPEGVTASVTHLWADGGFFPQGLGGFFAGFQIAVFAFVGIELVGTTAAEAKNPTRVLPQAVNSIPIRILFFYLGALAVIMCVTPWRQVDPAESPFVNLFNLAGLAAAAGVMNFVVLTSASSSCNAGIYSTSRMLFGLAHKRAAPAAFGKLSRSDVPARALYFSVICIAPSLLLIFAGQSVIEAFTMVTTVSAVFFMVIWSLILASYIVYRRRKPQAHANSLFKMPGASFMPWVVLAFFAFVVVLLTQQKDTLTALLVTPIWFIGLAVAFYFLRHRIRSDNEVPHVG